MLFRDIEVTPRANLPADLSRALEAANYRAITGTTTASDEIQDLIQRYPILLDKSFFPRGPLHPLAELSVIKHERLDYLPVIDQQRRRHG